MIAAMAEVGNTDLGLPPSIVIEEPCFSVDWFFINQKPLHCASKHAYHNSFTRHVPVRSIRLLR